MENGNKTEETMLITKPEEENIPPEGPVLPVETVESDYGNALRVKFYFNELIFYHHNAKVWYRWTGRNWQRDTHQYVTQLVVEAIRNIISIEIPWLRHLKKNPEHADIAIPDPDYVPKSLSKSKIKAAKESKEANFLKKR